MIGTKTLSEIEELFAEGRTPAEVAKAAGMSRNTLLTALYREGKEPVPYWRLKDTPGVEAAKRNLLPAEEPALT